MSDSPSAQRPRPQPQRLLFVLMLVLIVNNLDRQLLVILIEPLKRDLGLSDTVLGILAGPAYAFFYTVSGIPLARLADRTSRRAVIAVGLVSWSVMTAAHGLVRNLAELAVARILVGIGESSSSPASHSLLADAYPPERRATALSILTMGGHLGILLGLALGGILEERVGWRAAFVVVGLPGVALAGAVWLTVREPPRRGSASAPEVPAFGEVLRHLARKRSFRHLAAAAPLFVLAAYGFNVWGPTFLIRVHHLGIGEAGVSFGLVTGLFGAAGTFLGGVLADNLSARDPRWSVGIPAIGGVAMAPFAVGFLLAPSPALALLCYAPTTFLLTFWMGPSFAVAQGLATLPMRAQVAAILLFLVNLVGMGIGPPAVGILNDALEARYGATGIRWSMFILLAASAWGSLHALLAARTLLDDLEETPGVSPGP